LEGIAMLDQKDFLTPVFQMMTGLSFLVFLGVMLKVRSKWRGAGGMMLKLAMLPLPLGFFLIAEAGKQYSLGNATPFLIAAGGSFFVTLLLMGGAMILLTGNGPVGDPVKPGR
jgi:hypothetical protein